MTTRKEKTICLHLGTYKTATTFLQWVLRKNFRDPDGDVYYPRAGRHGDAHHYLATDKFPDWGNGVTRIEYEKTWRRLLREIRGINAGSVVISSEMFASDSLEDIRYIRDILKDYRLRAIIYLRRQDQYVSSLAAQLIKHCNGPSEYYTNLDSAISLISYSQHFDFENMCDQWASVIGAENLIVRPFEPAQFHEGDILRDFFHHLLDMPVPEKVALPSRNMNPRLCRDALEFKQLVNRMPVDRDIMNDTIPGLFAYSSAVDALTQGAYQEHVLLSPFQRLAILERCAENNARIARKYLGREDGVLFKEPLPDTTVAWTPYPGLSKDALETIVSFLGNRSPGVVELLVRAAPQADSTDRELQHLSTALINFAKGKRSVAAIVPSILLMSRPVRFLGKIFSSKRNKISTGFAGRMSPVMEENLDLPVNEVLTIMQNRILNKSRYFGIMTAKNPLDFWVYQELLFEMRPDVIVEIGDWTGGSTLALAHFCDLIGKGRVIAVNIDQSNIPALVRKHKRTHFLEGEAPELYNTVSSLIKKEENVLVIEDGSHTYKDTLAVLRSYSQLTRPGHYFIVEDGICHHGLAAGPSPGPYEAIETFVKERDGAFIIDRSKENFFITWNPKGFLKRIR